MTVPDSLAVHAQTAEFEERAREAVDLLMALVPAGQPHCENSLDGPLQPPFETLAAVQIAPHLEQLGFETRLQGPLKERQSLVAERRFGPGPTLLLNDHLDTYPAGPRERWSRDPYVPEQIGKRVYGRGTSDTRGNIVAMILALRDLVSDPPTSGSITVALTSDEERNGLAGSVAFIEAMRERPDASITIEPTTWSKKDGHWGIGAAVQHTGHAVIEVRVTGRASHIWRPDTGVNTGLALNRLLARLETELGKPFAVVSLQAGEPGMAQFTPLEATATIAVTAIESGERAEALVERIDSVAADQLGEVGCEVRLAPGPTFIPGTEPVDDDDPIIEALDSAYLEYTGEPVRRYVKPSYCDTMRFRHAGIPALTFGPGDDGWDVYDESIGLEQVDLARNVLSRAIRRFLTADRS